MSVSLCLKSFLRYSARNTKTFNTVCINGANVLLNQSRSSDVPYIKQQKSSIFTSPTLLKKPHTNKNWKYLARDGKKPDKPPSDEAISVEEGSDSIRHLELMNKLQNCSSLSQQIEVFISELSLTPEDFENRTAFCKELEKVFGIYLPKFRVHQFGSSVNGLGFKGCDLDVCLQTHFNDEAIDYVMLQDVPRPEQVKDGVVPLETIYRLTPFYMLRFVRKMLFLHCKDINSIIIIKARCPILRFYSSKYDLFCDFSMESKISVRNTLLLKLLGHLDERFPVLTKIIRYWGKFGGFVGDIDRFNSYSFSLLVVHFLQTRNPPILPSVNEVYSKSEYLQQVSLDNTDLMFEDLKKFPPSNNTKTVEELLREFFFYYLTYDYSRIMQPSVSSSVPLADFVPDKNSEEKFEVNTVNIQDPFRPNFNVTTSPSFECCLKFRNSLYQACEVYQNDILTPSTKGWGLPLLFNRQNESETKMLENWKKNLFHAMEIPALPDAARKVKKILEHALLFHCSDMYVDSDEASDSKLLLKLKCKVYNNTWTGRDFVIEKLEDSDNQLPLEVEHLISKTLASQSEKRQVLSDFMCECKENSDGKLTVEFNFKESKVPFLAVFLKEYIPSMIKKL